MMNLKDAANRHIENIKFEVAQEMGLQKNCAYKENQKKSKRK